MTKYKSFIPTHLFDTDKKQWHQFAQQSNWIGSEIGSQFDDFVEISFGIILGIYKEPALESDVPPLSHVFKGVLEYTDEYQLELDAELKELSKDFKFNLKTE